VEWVCLGAWAGDETTYDGHFFRKTAGGALSPALALALKLARVNQKKSDREGDIIWVIVSICAQNGGSEKRKKKTKL